MKNAPLAAATHLSPEQIQRFVKNTPDLLLVLQPGEPFIIVAASDAYLKATHTDRGIFGRPVFEAFPDNPAVDARATRTLRASLQRVADTRETDVMATQRYDVQRPAAEGAEFEERFWNTTNSPVLSEDGGTVEYILHRIEEAAARTRRDAVAILESITEGFFTLDRKWRFDYVNREAHRILGRERGTLEGRTLWSEYPGLEGTEFERSYRRTMEQREMSSFTAFYAGHDRWYEVTAFPAPEGVSVYFRDVTAPKRLEAERERLIAESETQRRIYETALDSILDFVYVFDLEHRAIYANEALLKVWGVDDVRGKRWMELGYEQWHADLHDAEIDEVIRTRAPIRAEIPFTGTNGRRIYDYIFAPVLGAQGEVVAIAGTTRDVTDRQAAEQAVREHADRLAQADRAKDEFLATLSHELRNPLAPLRNALTLMRRADPANPKTERLQVIMERQLNHLVRLVDDLLELSRISRGVLSLRREPVDVAHVIRSAIETCDPLIQAAGHELSFEAPAQPLRLDGDPVRLAQVVANLLNNAARYTEQPGSIAVRCRREGGEVVVSVRDTGIGIEPEALPRMFEMFSRGLRDGGQAQGGPGIGLALSRRLAEMHGGTLEGRSEGAGKGSEFVLRLPAQEAGGQQQPSAG